MLNEAQRQQIESLYRRYGKGVGSYVLTRTGDRHLAESITARAFLIVVRRFEQCTGNLVAWLWSIVRSELARHFRDRKVHEPLAGLSSRGTTKGRNGQDGPVDPSDVDADPARRAEQADMAERTRWALEQLDEPAHSLVYMKFFLEMSSTDIAEAMGMTPGNVGVSCHRALKKLKELMEPTVAVQVFATARPSVRETPGEPSGSAAGPSLATAV
ncbi:RNA polymerase sigma factor [Humisphaera borealis]|uniref:Sigma-70 family RNA polymerase sigma factor n=1 Tax=Humisphaera borealis TaxID=2807512 RepID=A0A7M2WSS8_9BACT|nr:sigma-70 family RNA polymerase sigma factor [Humisphaera borealis]QOV88334.1 sigma-70 family RNA polymerase sigma factor [Humisphaera borealis]